MVATEEGLRKTLFGERRYAEVVFACVSADADGEPANAEPVGFALFFHNYSTFLGRPGIYLEDLFVNPDRRGRGYGKAFFRYLARMAKERDCGRVEWAVLNWNTPAIDFYKSLGAVPLEDWRIFRLMV
jgi:GNAT superfamily N-acetyltransferase